MDALAGVQRYALVVLAPMLAVTFWSGAADPTNVVKASFVAWVAVIVLVAAVIGLAATRRLSVQLDPAPAAAVVMLVGLLIATLLSDVPGASYAGEVGRSDGLLLYASCIVCFLAAAGAFASRDARPLAWAFLLGGAFAAGYGLLQAAGIDPVGWSDSGLSKIIGTFGNADFESGYVGIIVPIAGWGVITRTWPVAWRVASGLLAVACLAVALRSGAIQGLVAAGAGLAVLVVAYALETDGKRRTVLLGATAGVTALGLLAAVLTLLSVGPFARIAASSSLGVRRWYWSAAWRMFRAHPFAGVGLDRYGAYYRSFRPAAAAQATNYSDAAHSVPLHFLATGGLLVTVPYVVLVLSVTWAVVRGLRALAGESRLLLGGLAGAWLAYQVQSLVSIDQPGLAGTHWLLAGAVVSLAGPLRRHERLLPGAVVVKPRRGRVIEEPTLRAVWNGATVTIATMSVAVGLFLLWHVGQPLRASHAERTALVDIGKGEGNAALTAFDRATRIAGWEDSYWLTRGRFLEQVRQQDLAAQSYAHGLARDPRSWDLLTAAYALNRARKDTAAVDALRPRLLRVNPHAAAELS